MWEVDVVRICVEHITNITESSEWTSNYSVGSIFDGQTHALGNAYIASLARKDRWALDLAHMTLLAFADLERRVVGFLDEVLAALRGFEADAFHVGFNRIVEGRCVTLRSRRLQREARDFQDQLKRSLRRRGFDDFRKPPDVHLTINYRRDRQAMRRSGRSTGASMKSF